MSTTVFKHNVRQIVVNSLGQKVTKIETVYGDLGSGILDKNGIEIFENDIVKIKDKGMWTVHFISGEFKLGRGISLWEIPSRDLEIISRVNN